jgi:hypothetical protein
MMRPEDLAHYAEGLRLAGLPESGSAQGRRPIALACYQPGIRAGSPITAH